MSNETKQSARELLHEARGYLDVLNMLAYKSPIVASLLSEQGVKKLPENIAAIDAYLAAPSESEMELVDKIREPTMIRPTDVSMVRKGLAITYRTDWKLTKSDAAALIEGLQRSVPRVMLLKLLREYWPMGDEGQYAEVIRKMSDEFGVVIE